jgi:hypothetical protein
MIDHERIRKIRNLRAAYFQSVQVYVDERQWFDVASAATKLLSLDTELRLLEERDG